MTLWRLAFTAIVVFAAAEHDQATKSEQDKATLHEESIQVDAPKVRGMKKVVSMLESLRKKVKEEAEAEEITHESAMRECGTLKTNHENDINDGEDKKNNLESTIHDLEQKIADAEYIIAEKEDELKERKDFLKTEEADAKKKRTLFFANKADMDTAVVGLDQALRALKAGNKKSSLAQIRSVKADVHQVLLLADALGFASAPKAAAAFMQQAPTQEMQDYDSHSDGILATLEEMSIEFKKQRNQLEMDEQSRVASFQLGKQNAIGESTACQVVIDDQTADKKRFAEEHINAENQLESTQKELEDNKKMLYSTNTLCEQKEDTYKQRRNMANDEEEALRKAQDTIQGIEMDTISGKQKTVLLSMQASKAVASSESAMKDIEQEAEDSEAPATFLQVKAKKDPKPLMKGGTSGFMQKVAVKAHSPDDTRDVIVQLLRSKGNELHSSTLLTIASEMRADPLAKVKSLVEGLVDRLQKEAAEESSSKGHCDKQIAEESRKKEHSSKEVRQLNAQIAKLKALKATLTDEMDSLKTQEEQLADAKTKEEAQRNEERKEETAIQNEAEAGEAAVQEAMTELSHFYGKSKNKAAASKNWRGDVVNDASAGHSAEGASVIAMMDVIASDFKRTLANSKAEAVKADALLEEFQTTSDISIATHQETHRTKGELQVDTDDKMIAAEHMLKTETGIVDGAVAQLKILKASCNQVQTYEERVALRKQEIASLNKAHCAIEAHTDGNADTVAADC